MDSALSGKASFANSGSPGNKSLAEIMIRGIRMQFLMLVGPDIIWGPSSASKGEGTSDIEKLTAPKRFFLPVRGISSGMISSLAPKPLPLLPNRPQRDRDREKLVLPLLSNRKGGFFPRHISQRRSYEPRETDLLV
jgi:hypothetical protein